MLSFSKKNYARNIYCLFPSEYFLFLRMKITLPSKSMFTCILHVLLYSENKGYTGFFILPLPDG